MNLKVTWILWVMGRAQLWWWISTG